MRALVGLVLLLASAAAAEDARIVRLRWADAGQMITGKSAEVLTADRGKVKGRVRTVTADGIEFENGRTAPVARGSVAEIRMVEYTGNARHHARMLGGVAGLTVGLVGAAVIGMKEGSGKSGGDKAAIAALAIGGLPGGMVLGHLLGREMDKQVTTIRIIP